MQIEFAKKLAITDGPCKNVRLCELFVILLS